jgi:two-component system LytT family response regulator
MSMAARERRALIADDEPAARRGVRQLLARFPQVIVVGECRDGGEVLSSLDALAPDLIFLDVQMPSMGGFDVIRRRTPERMPTVVFLTAYDEFAIQAFEAQALDYLLKPVSEARFAATMARVLKEPAPPIDEATVVVPTRGGLSVLVPSEIDWIAAEGNYARVWTGDRNYLLRESLEALEARMEGHGFVRAHRCALVRIASVRDLTTTKTGTMIARLDSGAQVAVSRRLRARFKAALRAAALGSGL